VRRTESRGFECKLFSCSATVNSSCHILRIICQLIPRDSSDLTALTLAIGGATLMTRSFPQVSSRRGKGRCCSENARWYIGHNSGHFTEHKGPHTPEVKMFVLARAVTFEVLFIGLVLIFVPASLLSWSGAVRPEAIEVQQVLGMVICVTGAAGALWCVFVFATVGKGTPAPFDPPRRLVIQGPYRFVRNPMYIGAGLALAGAALFYGSLQLLAYSVGFFLITRLFVVLYKEPTLRRTFGGEYEAFCGTVRRWWPSK